MGIDKDQCIDKDMLRQWFKLLHDNKVVNLLIEFYLNYGYAPRTSLFKIQTNMRWIKVCLKEH